MRVALVLGSGGARGYAHLGVLNELDARGHQVVAIAGTSMGALVGGLAAAGKHAEFEAWVRTLTQRKLWQLLDPALSSPGAIKGARVLSHISELLGDRTIESLPIPFTAVASDLTTQREVWFQRGPIVAAIRASIAIPGALTPVLMGGRVLVDGGLLNPVPVEPVLAVSADLTLAVNLTGPDPHSEGPSSVHQAAELPEGQDTMTWLSRVGLSGLDMERLRIGRGSRDRAARQLAQQDGHQDSLSTMDILLGAWETVQAATARYRMATNPPDVVVNVPMRSCRTMDFHRASEMIELGHKLTAEALDAAHR